ncbi:MAG: hypothetical protein JST80_08350 [Bdellovibrionales bacterium]|nr:hypothetical protein [Bdellovibrionales bacterium]
MEQVVGTPLTETPIAAIATISRLVTKITDRISGDRSEYPLFVASVTAAVLNKIGIQANVFYGQAAWIEVMEDMSVMWAGCWGEHTHFWVATQFGEVVDLNTAVSMRKRAHSNPAHKPKHSPPLLWSREVPAFYRYIPEGLAEIGLDSERDKRWFDLCLTEVNDKLPTLAQLVNTPDDELDFPEEAIVCPGRRILDDAAQNFRHFDRALMVQGIPEKPF